MTILIDDNRIPMILDGLANEMVMGVMEVTDKVKENAEIDLQTGAATQGTIQLSEFTLAEKRALGMAGHRLYRTGEMAKNLISILNVIPAGNIITAKFGLPDTGSVPMGSGFVKVGGPYSYRGYTGEHGDTSRMTAKQLKWFWAQKRRLEQAGHLNAAAWAANRRNTPALSIKQPERQWLSGSMALRADEYVDIIGMKFNQLITAVTI